jgi:predicted RNase H-like nuclease (RuvC/YqgF family)
MTKEQIEKFRELDTKRAELDKRISYLERTYDGMRKPYCCMSLDYRDIVQMFSEEIQDLIRLTISSEKEAVKKIEHEIAEL